MITRVAAGWAGLPNPLKAAVVSSLFTANTIIGTAYAAATAAGKGDTVAHFAAYLAGAWFPLLMGYLYGTATASAFRAKQAANATLPSSPPPKGP